jgi:hypothetical protein
MELNKEISLPIAYGMNRDSTPSEVAQTEYIFALNTVTDTFYGDSLKASNESSNLLASRFKDGYKVVGFKRDVLSNNTYMFLTNPKTGFSEIGVLKNIDDVDEGSDVELLCGCDIKKILDTPLELKQQIEISTYETLISDECETSDKCLNFSIYHPILSIELKVEKSQTKLFFTDNYNPPRYINVSNLNLHRFKDPVDCGTTDELGCLDCESIKIFKDYVKPCTADVKVGSYGNLNMGRYELFMAYSDILGREVSQYFRISSTINIFDRSQVVTEQQNLANQTNKSIIIELSGINTNYSHYKVVSLELSDLSYNYTIRNAGIYQTNNTTVNYSANGSTLGAESVNIEKLFTRVPKWEKSRGMVANDGQLYQYGLTAKNLLNLQKVVTLMSPFLKWQTALAKENLYSFEDKESLHSGYMRNENYGFGIKFFTNTGEESLLFPFTFRPMEGDEGDLVNLPENKDYESVTGTDSNCDVDRIYWWQYYNSAKAGDIITDCTGDSEDVFETQIESEVFCDNEILVEDKVVQSHPNPPTNTPLQITIPLWTRTQEEIDEILDIETASSALENIEDFLPGGKYYDAFYNDFENLVYNPLSEQEPCEITLEDSCELVSPTPISSRYFVDSLENISSETTYIETLGSYSFQPEEIGIINYLALDENGNKFEDPLLTNLGINGHYKRIAVPAQICDSPTTLQTEFLQFYHHEQDAVDIADVDNLYEAARTALPRNRNTGVFADFVQNKFRKSVAPNDYYNLGKNALWFKGSFGDNRTVAIIEIKKSSKLTEDNVYNSTQNTKTLHGNLIRVTFYKNCTDLDPAPYNNSVSDPSCFLVNTEVDTFLDIKKTDFPSGDFYMAIDVPPVEKLVINPNFTTTSYAVYSLVNGSINIRQRLLDPRFRIFNYENIILKRRFAYKISCTYSIPKPKDCELIPYREGEFGYYESVRTYPNNRELYDSTDIKLKPSDIVNLTTVQKERFEEIFTDSLDVDGNYILKDSACLMGKNIRFYKFPDNNIAPFLDNRPNLPMGQGFIYPIGVKIDNNVINTFLDIAVNNNLLSQKERDSIVKYEIHRTDRSLSKSIIAKGLLYDTYQYKNLDDETIHYANYPYNCLNSDVLHLRKTPTSSDRHPFIKHPFEGQKNNVFTFHSPDTHFLKPSENIFSEMYIEGYQYGNSEGEFKKVLDHSKHVILGKRAINSANAIGSAEAIFEVLLHIGNMTVSSSSGHPITAVPSTAFAVILATSLIFNTVQKIGKYRYQWLDTFYNLKSPENFAYKYSSYGVYNSLRDGHQQGEIVRGIKTAKYIKGSNYYITETSAIHNGNIRVNNTDRESTLVLSLGDHFLEYKENYKNWDTNNDSSRFIASTRAECQDNRKVLSRIASPYITLRNFLTAQYGELESIRWINTNYCGNLNSDNKCDIIFGGDIKISRMTLKRKMPIFLTHMVGLADRTPFAYRLYQNVGTPKFFANFRTVVDEEEDDEISIFSRNFLGINIDLKIPRKPKVLFPRQRDQYRLDCGREDGDTEIMEDVPQLLDENKFFYAPKDSKFYLQYYGVPSFLVESEINLNYRYARKEPWEWFYPDGGASDLDWWTQETNVPINRDNEYNYNLIYLRNISEAYNPGFLFPRNYIKKDYDLYSQFENGIISSEVDRTESSTTEPWLVYKVANIYEFENSLGKLVDVRSMESLKLLARFENQYVIINPQDSLRERITENTRIIGTGIFQQRPIETFKTELGYAGTQHRDVVSCEYGRFFTDCMRGQVLMIPIGTFQAIEISAYKRDGKPSGMRRWFLEQLPFKILKGGIENLKSTDLDNSYNSAGITMVWDTQNQRFILTKKDYIVKDSFKGKLRFEDGKFYIKGLEEDTLTDVTNENVFEEASFTISYYPKKDAWGSFHSYTPNYYIPYAKFFQSGNNNSKDVLENGVWSHLVTNRSYQVFYGKKYPWIIEPVRSSKVMNKVFHSFSYNMDVRRYHNKYDFSENPKLTFNKGYVYNRDNNSGLLNFIVSDKDNYFQQTKYPKIEDSSSDILITNSMNRWSFNDVYNRVKKSDNNLPIWNNDNIWANKKLDNRAIEKNSFWNDRIRGDYYTIRLEQDEDTRHNFIFRIGTNNDKFNI